MASLRITELERVVFEWPRLKIRRSERDMFAFYYWRNPSWLRLDPPNMEVVEVNHVRRLNAINN